MLLLVVELERKVPLKSGTFFVACLDFGLYDKKFDLLE